MNYIFACRILTLKKISIMNKKTLIPIITLLFIASVLFFSCNKDRTNILAQYASVEFRLTDAPCDYDHLYIDIQGIEIHSDSNGWESLEPFNAGIYDILELTNGLDTLLCKVILPEGEISQIRLVLGDNNTLVSNGNTYDLKVPSGSTSGLKLNLHKQLVANTSYTVWLDFDACKSIVVKGNGSYSLKPVIRAYADSSNGKLMGYVLPDSSQTVVHAIKSGDTISTIPASNGYFAICGLDGTYDILFEPANAAFSDSLIQGLSIPFGQIVSVDTVFMQ